MVKKIRSDSNNIGEAEASIAKRKEFDFEDEDSPKSKKIKSFQKEDAVEDKQEKKTKKKTTEVSKDDHVSLVKELAAKPASRGTVLRKIAAIAEDVTEAAKLVAAGAVPEICKVLTSTQSKDQLSACAYVLVLLGKADVDLVASQAAEGGALEVLVKCMQDKDRRAKSIVENAIYGLVQLSLNEVVRRRVGEMPGVAEATIKLMEAKTAHILDAISNFVDILVADEQNRSVLRKAGIVALLPPLLEYKSSPLVVRNAVSIISQLADDDTSREILRTGGVVGPLIQVISTTDSMLQAASLAALTDLALDDVCKEEMRRKGAIRKLLILLSDTSLPEDTRQASASVLFNLAVGNEKNQAEIGAQGGIQQFVELLQAGETETFQTLAAGALYNIASEDGCKDMIREAGAIPVLIQLMDSPFDEVQDYAVGAITNLCANNAANRTEIMNRGGFKILMEMLTSSRESILVKACNGLANMADSGDIRVRVREEGGIDTLVVLLSAPNWSIQAAATAALADLAIDDETQKILGAKHLRRFVDLLLPIEEMSVRSQAARAIANLVFENEENQNLVSATRAAELLTALLRLNHDEASANVLDAMYNMARHEVNRSSLQSAGAVDALVKVAHGLHVSNRNRAAQVLGCLNGSRDSEVENTSSPAKVTEVQKPVDQLDVVTNDVVTGTEASSSISKDLEQPVHHETAGGEASWPAVEQPRREHVDVMENPDKRSAEGAREGTAETSTFAGGGAADLSGPNPFRKGNHVRSPIPTTSHGSILENDSFWPTGVEDSTELPGESPFVAALIPPLKPAASTSFSREVCSTNQSDFTENDTLSVGAQVPASDVTESEPAQGGLKQISIRVWKESRGVAIACPSTMTLDGLLAVASRKLSSFKSHPTQVLQIWNPTGDVVDEIETILSCAETVYFGITQDDLDGKDGGDENSEAH